MRIAMFTEVFLPKIDGVVTRVLRTLEELAELGHEAIVFCTRRPAAGLCRIRGGSGPLGRLPAVVSRGQGGLPTARIAEQMIDFQPDVVHAVNPAWLAAYGVLSAKRRDIPLLASYHTQPELENRTWAG